MIMYSPPHYFCFCFHYCCLFSLTYPIQHLAAPLWLSWGRTSFWNWTLQSLSCKNIFSAACRIICLLYSGQPQRHVKQIFCLMWTKLMSSSLLLLRTRVLIHFSFIFDFFLFLQHVFLFYSLSALLIIFTWPCLCVQLFLAFVSFCMVFFFFLVLFFPPGCCSVFFCSLCVVFCPLVLWREFWSMYTRISRNTEIFW